MHTMIKQLEKLMSLVYQLKHLVQEIHITILTIDGKQIESNLPNQEIREL